MKILFVHQNYPGQFLHLAPALMARGHECRALTDAVNKRTSPVPTLRYKFEADKVDPAATRRGLSPSSTRLVRSGLDFSRRLRLRQLALPSFAMP